MQKEARRAQVSPRISDPGTINKYQLQEKQPVLQPGTKRIKSIITVPHGTLYSILFLPSSALEYLAALRPRSCLATRGPSSGSFLTLLMVSW